MEVLAQKQVTYNTSLTETGAHTIKTSTVTIPGTEGAKRVIMMNARIVVDNPDVVASTLTKVRASIVLGTATVTDPVASVANTVVEDEICIESDATPLAIAAWKPAVGQLQQGVSVPPENGAFKLTLSVLGVSTTAAKSAAFAMQFLVEY